MTNQGMISSHQNSFSALYRVFDLFTILMLLLLSASIYGISVTPLYFSAAMVAALGYLLMAESLEVYRSWRASTAMRMVTTTASAWAIVCVAILVIGFFAKVSESFSR